MRRGFSKNGLVAALDVGSTKTCCFIAREQVNGQARIIGIGQQASQGLKGGSIIGLDLAEASVLNAVHAAEQMAGETIDRVIVNLSGGYPASSSIGIEVMIDGHEVGEADLRRVLAQGQQHQHDGDEAESGRQTVHSIPTGYSIDGNRGIRDPLGMCGDQLGVNLHVVTAASSAIRNLSACIQRCHLDIAGFVVSPYASGLSCLVEDEMDLGVTVIDMGGGTTTISVFLEGNVIFTDLVPVGGSHVTNDIARGLSTPIAHAERMKTLYSHVMPMPADEQEMIDVPQVGEGDENSSHQVPRSLLVGIVQPRLEETLELVRSRLEASGFDKVAGRRVVLTGGASQLPGLRDLASLILDKQVRIGRPTRVGGLAEATSGPAYATCAGLLVYALGADNPMPFEAREEEKELEGLVGRLSHWFREHF
ncbi:MAG: cell division protein FtsA [Pseudomonadota bacterium]